MILKFTLSRRSILTLSKGERPLPSRRSPSRRFCQDSGEDESICVLHTPPSFFQNAGVDQHRRFAMVKNKKRRARRPGRSYTERLLSTIYLNNPVINRLYPHRHIFLFPVSRLSFSEQPVLHQSICPNLSQHKQS